MKKMFTRTALVCAMAALGMQQAAAVTPGLVAELKQLHIELIDLDPADGVAPSIRFTSEKPVTAYAFANPAIWPDGFLIEAVAAGSALAGGAVATTDPSTYANVSITAGDVLGAVSPTFTIVGNASIGSSIFSSASFQSVFTVSPHTRVVLSAQPGDAHVNLDPGPGRAAFAYANIGFCPLTASGEQHCYDTVAMVDLSIYRYAGEHKSPTFNVSEHPSLLTLAWDNTSASEQAHYLYAGALISASDLAPVPEPASTVLLTAGLGFVGVLLRRQRRRSA